MTREEAIRILASSCIPGSKQTEALETLIPELAESEDERIRKWLINFIKVRLPDAAEFEPEYRAALAWLEKPAEWSKNDEKIAYFVNQFLEYHENSDPTAKSCKKWFNNRLKLLRPQHHGEPNKKPLTGEDIKTILDISFWNDDPEKILQEYNRLKK